MEDVDTRKTMHTARMRREVLRISQEIVENSYAYDAFGDVLEGKESIENCSTQVNQMKKYFCFFYDILLLDRWYII